MIGRWLYRVHKWLSVAAGLAALAWFVSGVVIVIPLSWRTLSPGLVSRLNDDLGNGTSPAFDDATIPVAGAIRAVRAAVPQGATVTSVRVRRFPGRIAYEVVTSRGARLVDARTGELVDLDESFARAIVAGLVGGEVDIGAVTRETTRPSDYRGALPVFRLPVDDGKATVFYVSGPPVEIRFTDRLSRPAQSIVGWHDFNFLRSLLSANAIRVLMFGFAILGVLLSATGFWILGIQFARWRRAR